MFEQAGLQIEYFISLQKERAHHHQIANVKRNGSWTEMSRANSPTTEETAKSEEGEWLKMEGEEAQMTMKLAKAR